MPLCKPDKVVRQVTKKTCYTLQPTCNWSCNAITTQVAKRITRCNTSLNLVPTCPKNRKNGGLLRSSDVWDSYDQCEHPILDIPDGRRFLRHDQKNRKHRKHFYFEGTSQTIPDVGDFYDECEHEICLYGTSGMLDFVFTYYQSLIFSEL